MHKRRTVAGFFYIVVLTKTTGIKKSKGGPYPSFILYDGTMERLFLGTCSTCTRDEAKVL